MWILRTAPWPRAAALAVPPGIRRTRLRTCREVAPPGRHRTLGLCWPRLVEVTPSPTATRAWPTQKIGALAALADLVREQGAMAAFADADHRAAEDGIGAMAALADLVPDHGSMAAFADADHRAAEDGIGAMAALAHLVPEHEVVAAFADADHRAAEDGIGAMAALADLIPEQEPGVENGCGAMAALADLTPGPGVRYAQRSAQLMQHARDMRQIHRAARALASHEDANAIAQESLRDAQVGLGYLGRSATAKEVVQSAFGMVAPNFPRSALDKDLHAIRNRTLSLVGSSLLHTQRRVLEERLAAAANFRSEGGFVVVGSEQTFDETSQRLMMQRQYVKQEILP